MEKIQISRAAQKGSFVSKVCQFKTTTYPTDQLNGVKCTAICAAQKGSF